MQQRSEAEKLRKELETLRERLAAGGLTNEQFRILSARALHRLKQVSGARQAYAKT